jgi:conjugal transfer/entry exclusion protein
MFRRTLVGLVLVLAMTTSARAQLVVIDPANLYQTVLIAERTWQHYQELRRQYETILRMSRGLGNMES